MTNYYLVFVGWKCDVCDSWIECQRKVIFYKGGLYNAYTFRDEAMWSWVLYPLRRKRPDGSSVGISSFTSNYGHEDKKQMEKYSSAMYSSFINWVIIALMYVIVVG